MNPTVEALLAALVRYVIIWALGALLAHHVITEDQHQQFADFFTDPKVLLAVAGAILTLMFAAKSIVKSRVKLLTALSLPSATTEHVVEQIAKTDAPPLNTPKNLVPLSLPTPNEPKE